MTLIGGNTGCGKTIMVNEIANGIDLEGAANHRGSSFGRYVTAQRTQINFENVPGNRHAQEAGRWGIPLCL